VHRAGLVLFIAVVSVALVAAPPSLPSCAPTGTAYAGHVPCCKYCTKGKACGNTCIARWKTCRVGHGCACDAWGFEPRAIRASAREALAY